jgi:hypothetical protein
MMRPTKNPMLMFNRTKRTWPLSSVKVSLRSTSVEVLISIGILAIGLTCVLGLIVAGRTSAARSIVYDQIGTVTENARADALTLGLTRLDALTSPTGGDCPAPPLIFDPIGLATGVWPAASGLHPAVLRAGGALSVPDTANAQPRAFPMASYAFESRDDLATVAPSNDDDLPRNQFTAGVRSFHGRTTWLALLTHPFTTPLESSQQATLTIIVCHKREPGVMPPPAGTPPPDLRLTAADRLEWSTGTLLTPQQAGIRAFVPGVFLLISATAPILGVPVLGLLQFVPLMIYVTVAASPVYRGVHDKAAGSIVLAAPRAARSA